MNDTRYTNNKIIIGLIGEKGAGKETFTQLLRNTLLQTTQVINTSNLMAETLELWTLEKSRHNLQQIALLMERTFGEGTMNRALAEKVNNSTAEVIIWDSIRFPNTFDFVNTLPRSILVYITASAEARYERIRLRKQKVGEDQMTLQEFIDNEQVGTEKDIPMLGHKADFTLDNNGNMNQLEKQVRAFCQQFGLG
ncbi:hypothetical protein A2631_00955 [Candidatus Daviesbacteria bacterium RIFCSPHIGHO2_01_FULL_44_29]|uniref:Dephospho-CoA kinase n=1 Tax=Candidatus Daviesbacteria bacterium RIFCSPHIGHO2_02_FULL_43_12 TaxID=1797776 RepID=A0A1F5KHX9_9BACT|nr:MAG: hypothetical protein A2631_00955 [Candidatus Daviesbacteria bacterium RIFCSPHIGHO2_01_FULL_44_29]OGE38930.1 MAG: hypothetical protein A3E86_04720 [Candidatus Daviesbacteria bacterium RIFCSPHIGHO2_12_FULL_47_45]OGE40444.1 MAG: hypothetical protein A3D25_05465 [Candidatus Daviesbacteria bacterium RIFCSPHIGHO2_02_FULL_43_12]OGE69716.1 MAG: hypothetical protein A3B55_05980 [Candidatus Daviesbacteria bacterium RIFCSPLOWO2_01_FULL_43_15]